MRSEHARNAVSRALVDLRSSRCQVRRHRSGCTSLLRRFCDVHDGGAALEWRTWRAAITGREPIDVAR